LQALAVAPHRTGFLAATYKRAGQGTVTEFDVFLSHNSRDKPAVRELARRLVERDIRVWLDEEQLVPGRPWQELLEEGIGRSETGAVLVGKDGLGPWENLETRALLSQAVEARKPVIPVLLPNAPVAPELPLFLKQFMWVDLRPSITDDSLDKLIWGIRGERPESLAVAGEMAPEAATTPAQLWPDRGLAEAISGTSDCYASLYAACSRGEVPPPEERRALWQAVKKQRPSSFLAWQLAAVARWGTPEYLEVDERFTPLQVQVRVRENEEGPAEKQQLPFDTLAEAMAAVFDEQLAPAGVIFAPPGGGKSTLLRHHQLQQARRLEAGERLAFYVQLRDYRPERLAPGERDDTRPALAWLESEWRRETGQAPPLEKFMRQGRLTLLLDGLNEIPRDDDAGYRARVAEWRELVDAVDREHPGVHLLFACRPLDYSERLDAGRHTRLPKIEVQAMEPKRIEAFVHKRFDDRTAGQVWAQMQERTALTLYSSPYALNLLLEQIDTGASEIRIPRDRAALFGGMVRARLRRECQKGTSRFANPKLLSDGERTALMSGKAGTHWLPEDTPLFEALAALAFHIQDTSGSNERWGSLGWRRARKAMAAALEGNSGTESYLQAGCDLGLFEDEAALAREIRFVHQQMQEYFAARALAQDWDAGKLSVPWRSSDLSVSSETLLAQEGDDELPELPSTGWEESALMAASLCERSEAFIRDLIPANLPLAGRCAAQPGLKISDELRAELRTLLIDRTRDPQADLRARIAAGKALGELGDPRLAERPAAAGARPLLPAFADIPGGRYRIGGDPEGDPDEQPGHDVTLAGFELAIHPVTNAEYARFLEAGGYREDAYWPGRALAWRNGEIGQEARQQVVREGRETILDALGPDATAEAIRDRFNLPLRNAKWWQERIAATEEDFEAWLLEAYPPPAGPFTEPALWRSPSWGNPAQPVVGVCWYEARAYCLWLSHVLGTRAYRLPSEAEWEAAARGRGAWRRYAWPGDFDPLRANTAETRLAVTTPVGVFPGGVTPDTGLLDLCGNVWEWTQDAWYDSYEGAPADGSAWESEDAGADRVIRGGSWYGEARSCRCAYRDDRRPAGRNDALGFRCARVQG
jgi:formylglycine-generating enzyme required for sulfatase activity